LDYKTQSPVLDSDTELNIEKLMGYVEDIKAETEARITMLENIINQMKRGE